MFLRGLSGRVFLRALTSLVVAACGVAKARGDTIYVNNATGDNAWDGRCAVWDGDTCGPKLTIQAGIDAAVAGDEVVIADGTYTGLGNKDLDPFGKAITVRSAAGDPNRCIIDCEDAGRGFYLHNNETTGTVIAGLTITRGWVTASSPGGYRGGALYAYYASPTIDNCTIRDNGSHDYAGGLYLYHGMPNISHCTISGNFMERGAGVFCYMSDATISDCIISENTCIYDAGGVRCFACSPTITDSVICDNWGDNGGAIDCYDGAPLISHCLIRGNWANSCGGAINCNWADPLITNCALTANSAYLRGGGVWCSTSNATVTYCTIAHNTAPDYGGALACELYSDVTIANSILWGNAPYQLLRDASSVLDVTRCDVQGGWVGEGTFAIDPGFAFTGDIHLASGSPCIDAGIDYAPGGVPANDLDGNLRPLDGDGDEAALPDLGAYEYNPAAPSIALDQETLVFHAGPGGTQPADQILLVRNCGGGTLHWEISGTPSWLTAEPSCGTSDGEADPIELSADMSGLSPGTYSATLFVHDSQAVNAPRNVTVHLTVPGMLYVPGDWPTIQAAIDATVPGDIVVIADGTYTGDGNRRITFRGKAITVRSASGDPNACVVDCEWAGYGFSVGGGTSAATTLLGVTITHALGGAVSCSDGSPSIVDCRIASNGGANSGAGVWCRNANPTLTRCTISDNFATDMGAGVYCNESSPRLVDCTITRNSADRGGGIYLIGNSSPVFMRCDISHNTATVTIGGGACCNTGTPTFSDCDISCNSAVTSGGGLSFSDAGGSVVGCIISGNKAGTNGGGVCCDHGAPGFAQCTITSNVSMSGGGALFCDQASAALYNSILWGNEPQQMFFNTLMPAASHCCVLGGWSGVGNTAAHPNFVRNPSDGGDGWGDDPTTPGADEGANDDYGDPRLSAQSPCIDAGDNAGVPNDLLDLDGDGDCSEARPLDLDGLPRFLDDPASPDCRWSPGTCGTAPIVDMGAYEYVPLPTCLGDANCDRQVDFADINSFVDAVLNSTYCDLTGASADLDGNGSVGFEDINLFVGLLTTNPLPILCQ